MTCKQFGWLHARICKGYFPCKTLQAVEILRKLYLQSCFKNRSNLWTCSVQLWICNAVPVLAVVHPQKDRQLASQCSWVHSAHGFAVPVFVQLSVCGVQLWICNAVPPAVYLTLDPLGYARLCSAVLGSARTVIGLINVGSRG